jgi:hypothetical protein
LQINNAGAIGATAEIDTTTPLQDVVGPLTCKTLHLTFCSSSLEESLTVVICSFNSKNKVNQVSQVTKTVCTFPYS